MKMLKVTKNIFIALIAVLLSSSLSFAKDLRADVVVVGAGTSGTSAALSAVSNGAKTILIEKAPFPAGAGTFSGGMFAADSSQQIKEQKTVDKEWLFEKYMVETNYLANARLVKTIIDNAGKTVDFLNENGAQLSLVPAGSGGQYWHIGTPATLHGYQNGGGAKNIGRLQATFKKKGGTLLFETKGLRILQDKKGKIAGIVAEDADGDEFNIYAKAVIVATGGMGRNKKMVETYTGYKNPPLSPIQMAQGEGLKMAWNAGAKHGRIIGQWFALNPNHKKATPLGGDYNLWLFCDSPVLRVNKEGHRFFREDRSSEFAIAANVYMQQPDYVGWHVFDQRLVDRLKKHGLKDIMNKFSYWKYTDLEFYEFNEKNNLKELAELFEAPYDLMPYIKDGIKSGAFVEADTIEGLAKKMNIDPKILKKEVNRYNELAHKGEDVDFYNDPEFLFPVEQGPFYAFSNIARSLGTLGGVEVNENLQALDNNNHPINGLYVVGNDATGMYGASYIELEGATLGFAFTSGKLAGEHAAKTVK